MSSFLALRYSFPLRIALLCAVSATATRAQAAPADATQTEVDTRTRDARARWDEGIRAFDRGDYEAARVAFAQAYALMHVDSVLKNLAVAQLRSDHALDGARNLSRYLRTAKGREDSERTTLEKLLVDTEREVGRVNVVANVNGADLLVDGESVGRSPLGFDWHVAPGEHLISVSKAGYKTEQQTVQVAAGQRAQTSFRLPATSESTPKHEPPAQPARTSSDPTQPDAGGVEARTVVLVSGAALAVVATGLTVYFGAKNASANKDANDLQTRAKQQFGSDPCSSPAGSSSTECSGVRAALDDRNSAGRLANISLAVAGISAIGTAAAFFLWPRAEPRNTGSAVRVTPVVQHRSGLLVLTGQF